MWQICGLKVEPRRTTFTRVFAKGKSNLPLVTRRHCLSGRATRILNSGPLDLPNDGGGAGFLGKHDWRRFLQPIRTADTRPDNRHSRSNKWDAGPTFVLDSHTGRRVPALLCAPIVGKMAKSARRKIDTFNGTFRKIASCESPRRRRLAR